MGVIGVGVSAQQLPAELYFPIEVLTSAHNYCISLRLGAAFIASLSNIEYTGERKEQERESLNERQRMLLRIQAVPDELTNNNEPLRQTMQASDVNTEIHDADIYTNGRMLRFGPYHRYLLK